MTKTRIAVIMASLIPSLLLAPVADAFTLSANQMQDFKFFRAHSFSFPGIFRNHHPGPKWILNHQQLFHLSPQQKVQELHLTQEMVATTIKDVTALKVLYHKYEVASAKTNPNPTVLKTDITLIGKQQARAAYEMIPYHLAGYEALTPTQQIIYERMGTKGVGG